MPLSGQVGIVIAAGRGVPFKVKSSIIKIQVSLKRDGQSPFAGPGLVISGERTDFVRQERDDHHHGRRTAFITAAVPAAAAGHLGRLVLLDLTHWAATPAVAVQEVGGVAAGRRGHLAGLDPFRLAPTALVTAAGRGGRRRRMDYVGPVLGRDDWTGPAEGGREELEDGGPLGRAVAAGLDG